MIQMKVTYKNMDIPLVIRIFIISSAASPVPPSRTRSICPVSMVRQEVFPHIPLCVGSRPDPGLSQ